MFETADEIQKQIDEYFQSGMKIRTVIVGKPPNQQAVQLPCPTITGLAIFLGFESRQSFYDYEQRPEFSYTIKRARLFIECEYEEILQVSPSPTGAIFALKNMGWKDKTEVEHVNERFMLIEKEPDDRNEQIPD